VGPQVIAQSQVPELVLAAGFTDVEVMRARPLGRLGGKARNRSGPDVLQAHRNSTESLRQAGQLFLSLNRPLGVVLDDADGRVEAVVERWVALEIHTTNFRSLGAKSGLE
jgi:hypothetical protein